MLSVPVSHLALVDEDDATGETAEIFADIRRELGAPSAGTAYQVAAQSPAVLASAWSMYTSFLQRATLPVSLLFMIHYAISSAKKCEYCSTNFAHACRAVGVEDKTLKVIVDDLEAMNPQRVRDIIKFAILCAVSPHDLTQESYDRLRDHGISDEEMVEIIGWSAVAMFHDTLSDALKLGDSMNEQFVKD
jgi:uncharacterized peroxidase-related enzyme